MAESFLKNMLGTGYGGYVLISAIFIISLSWAIFLRRKNISSEKKIKELEGAVQKKSEKIFSLVNKIGKTHEYVLLLQDRKNREGLRKEILALACNLLKAEKGTFFIANERGNELRPGAVYGKYGNAFADIKIRFGEKITGGSAQGGRPFFVNDIATDARFPNGNSEEPYLGRSFIVFPLKAKGRIFGVLVISAGDNRAAFDEVDFETFSLFASQAALIWENLALRENIQSFYFEIIQTLARTIDAKDSYTHEHADRAMLYTRMICKKLNLPDAMIRHIEYAAMVHDIGKIGIKEELLHKKGELSPQEQVEIRKHPQIGNGILQPVSFLSPVAPMVLYHHEWYNGAGYPDGLRGEEIPLGSRIVSVIDAYDAMTSDRPYKNAMVKSSAVEQLMAGKGTQFDPKIVDAFLEVLSEEAELKNDKTA